MKIDIRDFTPNLLDEKHTRSQDFQEWVTLIKPNMVVENTLCIMCYPSDIPDFVTRSSKDIESIIAAVDPELKKQEAVWCDKLKTLGLDVTRWRVHQGEKAGWMNLCSFYVTITLGTAEEDAVAKVLADLHGVRTLPKPNTLSEYGGCFQVSRHPVTSIEITSYRQKYAQIIITTCTAGKPRKILNNLAVQKTLKQFNRCLTPVQEPWKADSKETLTEVIKELYNEPELGEP
jgi:hypothetical protein